MPDSAPIWLFLFAGVWIAFAFVCRALMNNPVGDIPTGMLYFAVRAYVRLRHHLHVSGRENIPAARAGARLDTGKPGSRGPLVIVANHTAGMDPVLIQAPCQFHIRWMMGRDMFVKQLDWLWEWQRAIPVSRVWLDGDRPEQRPGAASQRADGQSALEAIRHLRAGGVLGVFPEGRIGDREGELLPFLPGVGVIVKKTGAAVLPVVISGTPRGGTAFGSLLRSSRARVRFLPVMEFAGTKLDAPEIVEQVRGRMASAIAAGT